MKAYCELPFERMKIDANGTYQSCCQQTQFYGNMFTNGLTLHEAYKGKQITDVKNSTLTKNLHPICNNTRCPLYHTHRERNREVKLTDYPVELEVALPSDWCNIGGHNPTAETACTMCPRSAYNFEHFRVPDRTDEIIEWIKPAIPHIHKLSILGVSEPFWKGKVFDILDDIEFKKYKEQIFFWTISNSTIFSAKIQDRFLHEYTERSCIGFSVDAASSETYRTIRKLNMFPTVQRNLDRYFNETAKFKEQRDWSLILNNINLHNLHEMEDMVRFAHNVGANEVEFNLTYISMEGMELNTNMLCNEKNWQYFWEGQQRAQQVADELGFKVKWYRPFHNGYLK